MAKKKQLSYKEIEGRLRQLKDTTVLADEIGYSLLYAFGKGERDIARMREGKGIIKTFEPGLLLKGEFCYRATTTLRLVAELEELKADPAIRKAAPKIIAVSDGCSIRAYDTRQHESFEQQVDRLYCDFEFFYPLAGVERIEYVEESPADIKAAEKLAKLHDEIRAYNEFTSDSDLHDLNIFIARLLFCFFAEDTGIFQPNIFTDTIKRYTMDDGSDLNQFLDDAFFAMATEVNDRPSDLPSFIRQFPFVSGGLFKKIIQLPRLSARARSIIIDCGDLDWQNINPDIFGSMIQAVVNPDERANQGMHYTSVPNIMKVIQPLFLDELTEEKDKLRAKLEEKKKLREIGGLTVKQYYDACVPIIAGCNRLLKRLSTMKFFDPACGSGNFLIITYKQLRLLEMDIWRIYQQCSRFGSLPISVISIQQFFGIELLDFPQDIAMLSLWLAEHQMNRILFHDFGVITDALPLKDINNIRCDNACRVDWNEVCPHTQEEEVFIFGNPPYLGSSKLESNQQIDRELVLGTYNSFKKIDYIGIWFVKGADYIHDSNSKYSFVSTNSICQGEMVEPLWKILYAKEVSIDFAYTSFKWRNNAKNNAGVTCIILGFRSKTHKGNSVLYSSEGNKKIVNNINCYLLPSSNLIVSKHNKSISGFKPISMGCKPVDGGHLILNEEEKKSFLSLYPDCDKWIKQLFSADDYINGKTRYCLWIHNDELEKAKQNEIINRHIKETAEFRLNSKDEGARLMAQTSHQFREFRACDDNTLVIPSTSSENRDYIPMGFGNCDMVVNNAMYMVLDAELTTFGITTSKMSMLWMQTIGGKLETRYRYTNLCYNSFPFPHISDTKNAEIEEAATDILLTREPYLTIGKTLADLYDPDTMPDDLREAHTRLDDIVESCYPGYPFPTDEARLECLFKMYEKMTKK